LLTGMTGMTSISLHMQFPLTSHSHGCVSQREQLNFFVMNQTPHPQRQVFNNMSLPSGVNWARRIEFGPRGELCHQGGMFPLSFTPRVFRRMEGTTSHLGDKVHQLRH
jgi:hypothetical protein